MGAVESFVRLFRGRGDAYGSWKGGCVRKPLTPEHFRRHLFGCAETDWIGVYNVFDTRCSWGCIDIDQPYPNLATNLRVALATEHIPSWIERTTRGYHVWVFPFDQVVDASTMRRALQGACMMIEYTPKEVFPKQTTASGTSLGNYVRLPMNGGLANPAPLDSRRFVHSDVSLQDMDQDRARTGDLERLAAMVPPPQAVDISVDIEAGLEVQWDIEAIGGKAYKVWRDGPRFGHDRSSTLARLAHRLAESDVPPNLAFNIVVSADQRWGKFTERGESGLAHLRKIVTQAYGAQQTA